MLTGLCHCHCLGRRRSQGEPAALTALLPGFSAAQTWRGGRVLPLGEEEKIIICKPRSRELLGAYLSRGRKRLCSLSAQRLFITLTRGWRKCSICWVQPAAHTAYKLRAFTCRVPEIKHTHTHKRERSSVPAPLAASPWLSLHPSPALAPVQEFHIICERFQLPQQGTALLLSSAATSGKC